MDVLDFGKHKFEEADEEIHQDAAEAYGGHDACSDQEPGRDAH